MNAEKTEGLAFGLLVCGKVDAVLVPALGQGGKLRGTAGGMGEGQGMYRNDITCKRKMRYIPHDLSSVWLD